MFLEPVSQIVAKELVGAVEIDLSVEKTRSIAEANPVAERKRVIESGQPGKSIRFS
jgi:hypothetical protein